LTLAALAAVRALRPAAAVRTLANAASTLIVAQVALGIFDVMTLAPLNAQLGHLALADGVWIALVLVAAAALGEAPAPAVSPAPVLEGR
jgi:heme A synthase